MIIINTNLFTDVEKMEDYNKDLCVRGFYMYIFVCCF